MIKICKHCNKYFKPEKMTRKRASKIEYCSIICSNKSRRKDFSKCNNCRENLILASYFCATKKLPILGDCPRDKIIIKSNNIINKKCRICAIIKPFSSFAKTSKRNGIRGGIGEVRGTCKKCLNEKEKQRRIFNSTEIKKRKRISYQNNKEKILKQCKKYQINNKEKIKKRKAELYQLNKKEISEKAKIYRIKNDSKIKKRRAKYRQKNRDRINQRNREQNIILYKTNPKFVLNHRIRNGIRKSLGKNKNGYHWELLVGYTLDELKKSIEKKFTDDMTWNAFLLGKIHIDHIIPISAFNFSYPDDIDFRKCWDLSNLQPLWKKDNLKKNNKIIKPFQTYMPIKIQNKEVVRSP